MEDVISKLDKIKNEYEEKKQRLEKELEEAKNKARSLVEEAKNEADEINKILNKLKKSSDYKNIDQKMNEIKGRINTYKDKYAKKKEELVKSNEKPIENVEVGDTVYVNSFSQNAKVLSVDDKKNEVVVQLGAIKMTLKKENISLEKKDKDTKGSKSGKIMKHKAQGATTSVDLRGMDLETALMEVDKYIDDSYLAGLEQLTIIHGVGTLVLKKGVQ